ncbi:hypothetical protein [Lachnoclostridium phytofermentans]|uniref:hypothetical protein n=1 Tax=Lachnoclostridium phytofermentans TaxID=66219 RepID=UPI0000D811F9|nr:hypothetical protein [Lachnoclostridium phytofermentans]
MNIIFKCEKGIGAISNTVKASTHKHYMLQLFLSSEDNLEIMIGKDMIHCRCIIVDRNVQHNFTTGDKVHFTMLIDPTSRFIETALHMDLMSVFTGFFLTLIYVSVGKKSIN